MVMSIIILYLNCSVLVRPHLEYAAPIWDPPTKTVLEAMGLRISGSP